MSVRFRPLVVIGASTAILAGVATAGVSAATGADSPPTVVVSATSDWGSGYVAQGVISDPGGSMSSWTVSFTMPAGESVTDAWSANMTQSGDTYTFTNMPWNGSIASGGSVTFGFEGGENGGFAAPTGCTLNGSACDGGDSSGTTSTSSGGSGSTSTTGSTGGTTTDSGTSGTISTDSGGSGSTDSGGSTAANFSSSYDSTWQGWGTFDGSLTITNQSSAPVSSWNVSFTLPGDEMINDSWNGNLTQSGNTYTFTNTSWNGTIASGASQSIGFGGNYGSTFGAPANVTVNGTEATASTGGAGTAGNSGSGSSGSGGSSGTTTTTSSGGTTTPVSTAPSNGGVPTAGGGDSANPLPPVESPTGSDAYRFAPYVDTSNWPTYDPASNFSVDGDKYYSLGFIVSQTPTDCEASWGTYYSVASGFYASQIAAIRADGGDVIISFGGQANTELAEACPSVQALEAQYESVIQEYGVNHIDFDIEGPAQDDTASLNLRWEAVAALEKADPDLVVSVTLPVLPEGLTQDGLAPLQTAIADGARIDIVNIMTMDFGSDTVRSNGQYDMLTSTTDALTNLHSQLLGLYPNLTSDQVWAMEGNTSMIGVNDDANEVVTPTVAQGILTFAEQHHLGRLSFWSANRDNGSCGASGYSSGNCSGIAQSTDAFGSIFEAYQG